MLDRSAFLSAVDLKCYEAVSKDINEATNPGCMLTMARGENYDGGFKKLQGKYNGHRCAECFTNYAMGMSSLA